MSFNVTTGIKNVAGRSGLVIKRILRRSDMAVLWSASNPYYAIQNGSLINCPNAVTEQLGGHSNSNGTISLGGATVYGSSGNTRDDDSYDDYWGAYTGNLSTYGCSKLSFTCATYETESGAEARTYWVYGDGAQISSGTINPNGLTGQAYAQTVTVDISKYSTVAVRVRIQDSNYSNSNHYTNARMGAGLVEVRLHN